MKKKKKTKKEECTGEPVYDLLALPALELFGVIVEVDELGETRAEEFKLLDVLAVLILAEIISLK
jgi:hypothetical protein